MVQCAASRPRGSRGRLLASLLSLLFALAAPASAVEEGERAPEFHAPLLDGKGGLALSEYRGKVVYLDFWASWCGPCLVSLPALEELRQEFPATNFQIVAVNLDREPAKARGFLSKRKIGYPSASDPDGRIPESFGLQTMPTSYLIDSKGVVRYVHTGFRKDDIGEIRKRIQNLLAEVEAASR